MIYYQWGLKSPEDDLEQPLGLYIHIPFCRAKCLYCSFNSYSGLDWLIPDYVNCLVREMDLWSEDVAGYATPTIYLGGGTPSLLPAGEVARLLDHCHSHFRVADAEVSLEANPGTVDLSYMRLLREAGVNRLSLGVQSFQGRFLRCLGRLHTGAQAKQAHRWARQAGFENISLDLIYGLPRQGLSLWRRDLEETLALGPEHVSLYSLTIEEGTPLARSLKAEEAPDPDLAADMYILAEELLGRAGYEHYEISNWALPGKGCRHNLTYWHNLPYLGLGAGAHSYLWGYRFNNVASPEAYIRRMKSHRATPGLGPRAKPAVARAQRIGRRLEMAETAMLGLRLVEGMDLETLARRFGRSPGRLYRRQRLELAELGLAEEVGGRLRLTPRGRLLGNEAFLRFLP